MKIGLPATGSEPLLLESLPDENALRIGDGSPSTVEFWPDPGIESPMVVFRNSEGRAYLWLPTNDYLAMVDAAADAAGEEPVTAS